jgi:hypothetical protein
VKEVVMDDRDRAWLMNKSRDVQVNRCDLFAVVEYCWHELKDDYINCPSKDHVFQSILSLALACGWIVDVEKEQERAQEVIDEYIDALFNPDESEDEEDGWRHPDDDDDETEDGAEYNDDGAN